MPNAELKNFAPHEFMCAGKLVFDNMDADFLALLDQCRTDAGTPMVITSSYRTPEHNRKVGGAKSSMHLQGRAVDVRSTGGEHRAAIIKAALNLGLSVGVMENAIHLDNRETQTVFHYYAKYRRNPA